MKLANFKKIVKSLGLVIAITIFGLQTVNAQALRDVSNYNPNTKIGLKGYDPVSYFPEGGGSPKKGLEQFSLDYMGVKYLFTSGEALNTFVQNPDKYEPTYGGWCAYAMASGSRVDIQPTFYTIHGNRLHLFVAKRAKQNFDSDIAGHELRADSFWTKFSGELPRL